MVFNPQVPPESYFPGAEHWARAAASPDAPPAPPFTSCLCQAWSTPSPFCVSGKLPS